MFVMVVSLEAPKRSSFKNVTREDCNLFTKNINSLCRDSLNGKSPYQCNFCF